MEVGSIYTHLRWASIGGDPTHPTHGCHVSLGGEHVVHISIAYEQLHALSIALVVSNLSKQLLKSM